eukprot:6213596-Pleurochrysis_carterae.AAC.3
MADMLSMASDVGASVSTPNSFSSARKYTASLVASDAAIISASQDERATVACFLEAQEIAA